jgi:N-formylglutamate deformylase
MNKIILHIPHSAIKIPFYDGYVVPELEIDDEVKKLTDWYTDDLFQYDGVSQIITPFSRVFCDVERFSDDEKEVMAKFGMGMIYTTFDDGRSLRKVDPQLRDNIYEQFYQSHHNEFLHKVEKSLEETDRCLIIDCHSFSNIPFERDLDKKFPRPDVDIGIDDFHTSKTLLDSTIQYFEKSGLSCGINTPYAGTIVPLKCYRKDKRIQSIMIEVNRDMYLEKDSNVKNKNYEKVKNILKGFINKMVNTEY